MGLLYVNGVALHDEDRDLIEGSRERRARYYAPAQAGDEIERNYSQNDWLQGLSIPLSADVKARNARVQAEVRKALAEGDLLREGRAAARARADQSSN